jgi:hypothetical protein
MDIELQGMEGIEATKIIKNDDLKAVRKSVLKHKELKEKILSATFSSLLSIIHCSFLEICM